MIATADVITADVDTTATATAATPATATPATPDNQPPAHQYPRVPTPSPSIGRGAFCYTAVIGIKIKCNPSERKCPMSTSALPATLGELKASGYESVSVREEVRRNLIAKMRAEEPAFPGIIGFDQTVIPQLGKRHPRRSGHHSAWRTRPGQNPPHPSHGWPPRRKTPRRRRFRTQRRPLQSH